MAPRTRRPEPGVHVADRAGVLRHVHPAGHPAQRAREPRLVHGLHAVPAGDLAGKAGGAPQLPDDGERPHRHGHGQRVAARRAHRGGRGDGDAAPGQRREGHRVLRRPRVPPADDRRRAHACRARRASKWWWAIPTPTCRSTASSACSCSTRAPPVSCATTARWSTRSTRAACWSRSPPTCSRSCCSPRRGSGAPTWWSVRRSASACRWATAVLTPGSWPRATSSAGTCPAGWSGCRSTPRAGPRCGSRCRRASSTSGGRRPPATSAPRRCCSPTSPACTPCTTAPTACAPSPNGCTSSLASSPAGLPVRHDSFFDTLSVRVASADDTLARARDARHQPAEDRRPKPSASRSTRPRTPEIVARVREILDAPANAPLAGGIPPALLRSLGILTHPVFRTYHSETQMLRYLRRLSDRDLALDRTMIPLGSCTMKLNATTEMTPITWPEFAEMHPFAPVDQAAGYAELFADLEAALCEITGYDAVSLQPNAGSQGELAGLLAIREYHASRGEAGRAVCLIPSSAHGTNAASAVMAGMRVVVVACDDDGNVDFDDLKTKAHEHAADLAALDGHVPVDPRRVRVAHRRRVRRRARVRRPGLSRRRQPQRPRRRREARDTSAPTSRTSTCTRRSASPTVGEGPASARLRCVSTSPRSCLATSPAHRGAPQGSCRSRRPTSR